MHKTSFCAELISVNILIFEFFIILGGGNILGLAVCSRGCLNTQQRSSLKREDISMTLNNHQSPHVPSGESRR